LKIEIKIRHSGGLVDPVTVAEVCRGFADLCRALPVTTSSSGDRVQIRARMRGLRRGSLRLEFLIDALDQLVINPDARALVVGIAGGLLIELFKSLAARTPIARTARAKEAVELLKNPQVAASLRDIVSALQRDPVVTEVEVSSNQDAASLDRNDLENADKMLAEQVRDTARDEKILWGKHVQIKAMAGSGSDQDWQIWWDDESKAGQSAWVRSPRIPSGESWTPGPNKRVVADLKVRSRATRPDQVEYAEILNVHWREMRRD
jgi:hypothetical protein